EIPIIQFAQEILELMDSSVKIDFRPLPQDDPKQRKPDITRAKNILDWEPKVSRKEGLRKTIEYFQNRSD
ncbi:MAG: SDR family NAD-dependent epimerase/dehydratase, partial [Planctomycetota bacterium]|nr:SDR family NAD-dependent epimerase/dehydratase [Planctomycetota bacterium]